MNVPFGVAVDSKGNVYIADCSSNRVLEESTSAGAYIQSTVASSGLSGPSGLAVDGSGNLYVADGGNSRVLKEALSEGTFTQSVVASSSGLEPSGVAVDGSGNIYFTDDEFNQVLKETTSEGSYTQSVVASAGLSHPTGIAVDGFGKVYFADTDNKRVLKETPTAGSYTQSTVPASGLSAPSGVAVNGYGNVYIGDQGTELALKEEFFDPPNLNFAPTPEGSASTPQTITLENVGNAELSLPVPGSENNPSISANFTLNSGGASACPLGNSSSSESGTLSAGAACLLLVTFTPAATGTVNGSLVVTDYALNGTDATQTVPLSGVSTAPLQAALKSPTPESTLAGPSVKFTWTAVAGATGYYLWLGSVGVGSGNLYTSGLRTGTSATATDLPANGGAFYARLYTAYGSVLTHADYTYTAATQAALTSPVPGSAIAGPSVEFTWTLAAGATGYYLWLGNAGVGSGNLYTSGEQTVTSVTPTKLQTDGETIYARLYTSYNGVLTHADYTYTAETSAQN